ncbi:MAG: RNA polymerase sigma factor [Thermodesulfovibrionales bacterium]|nr:RNA polymerase sigma factor [Thermodesulfovibrionales bacterium]
MNANTALSDEELIKKIKERDETAFGELVNRYKRLGLSLAHSMTGNMQDAEDISQEAFAIVYTEIAKFRGESSFKTWFYKIVLNLCRAHNRKTRLASLIPLHFINKEGEEEAIEIKGGTNPEKEFSDKQKGSAIANAVKRLPIKQREAFVMKHLRGLKISEISEIMGCAEGTVKVHLFRAVRDLQKKLKGVLR